MFVERSAPEIAEAFMAKFAGKNFERHQKFDVNQTRLMQATLAHPDSQGSAYEQIYALAHEELRLSREPTRTPPGWHLAFFTPDQTLAELGMDGTDTSYSPDAPYTRRMWAGGSIEWPDSGTQGFEPEEVVTESTRVLSCVPKKIKKTGETMLVVGVQKSYTSKSEPRSPRVVENRSWIFRRALDPSKPASAITSKPAPLDEAGLEALSGGKLVRRFTRTAAELFRFSALTFNAHRIHYDREWAREVEGHRDIVVHGPLNMISILDFWRHSQGKQGTNHPARLDYRATSPLYVNEPYRILMDADAATKDVTDVQVVSDDGTVCMTAQITR
jgi:hydroxyacyl-ACP dehydratase HTD2-like protein with hotdog domain